MALQSEESETGKEMNDGPNLDPCTHTSILWGQRHGVRLARIRYFRGRRAESVVETPDRDALLFLIEQTARQLGMTCLSTQRRCRFSSEAVKAWILLVVAFVVVGSLVAWVLEWLL